MRLPAIFQSFKPRLIQFGGFAFVSALIMYLSLGYFSFILSAGLYLDRDIWQKLASLWITSLIGVLLLYLLHRAFQRRFFPEQIKTRLPKLKISWWLTTLSAILLGGFISLHMVMAYSDDYQPFIRQELQQAVSETRPIKLLALITLSNKAERDEQLVIAARTNNIPMVSLLLKLGLISKLNQALFSAIDFHHEQLAKLLIQSGEYRNQVDPDYKIPLIIYATIHGNNEIVKCLIDLGIDMNAQDITGETALTAAVKTNNIELTNYLIAKGADVNAAPNLRSSMLMDAAEHDNFDMVKLLLMAGAKVAGKNRLGETVLHLAVVKAPVEDIRYLLSQPSIHALINERDKYNTTPLHIAAARGDAEIVRMLLDAGAEVNVIDYRGATALGIAAMYQHTAVTKMLSEAGGIDARPDMNQRKTINRPLAHT